MCCFILGKAEPTVELPRAAAVRCARKKIAPEAVAMQASASVNKAMLSMESAIRPDT
jgi:hypothetical protein